MKRYTAAGTHFVVGESATDNWSIIAAANKDFYWLHLDNYPSAHIIIEIDVEPTREEIVFATELVRAATPRAPARATIVWTQVSNLRRGSKAGEVYFKNAAQVVRE